MKELKGKLVWSVKVLSGKTFSWRIIAIIAVVVVVVAGAAYWFFLPKGVGEVGEPIKIGIVTNLAGAYSPEGIRARIMCTALATEINAKGGVYLQKTGKMHPVELIFYDAQSVVATYVELATKMVTEKKVHVMTLQGGPPPYVVPAVINIEKVGGVPCSGGGPIDTLVRNLRAAFPEGEKALKWTWDVSFNYTDYATAWPSFLSKYKALTNGKLGILYTDDVSGRDAKEKIVPALQKAGWTIIDPGLVPPGTTDFTSVIAKFKEERVDIVIVNVTPIEWIPFRRQCGAMGFKPKMFGVGRCMKIPEAEALGRELAEGICVECWWWYTYPYKGNEWFKENWDRIFGDMSMTWGEGAYYTGFMLCIEAVKIAGSLDRNEINEGFSKIDTEMPVGRVKFAPDKHLCPTISTIGQFYWDTSKGKWDVKIVWAPPGFPVPVSEATWPLP
ncbi:MAG: ABC transporter substrate-binding protein [Candidatus Bathyarchaeia archaeon]